MSSSTNAAKELTTVEQRLAELEAERAAIPKRVTELNAAYDDALERDTETAEIEDGLAKLERRLPRIGSAIEGLKRKRSDLRARRTLEDAEAKAAAIEAEGETLRKPFATVAAAVGAILPDIDGHPDFATVLVDGHAVPLDALAEALSTHVDRVVSFRVNTVRNNAQMRAIQRRAASQSIDPNDLDARLAAGDFELGTRTAEGMGKFHKIR